MVKMLYHEVRKITTFHQRILNLGGLNPYNQNKLAHLRTLAMMVLLYYSVFASIFYGIDHGDLENLEIVAEITPMTLHNIHIALIFKFNILKAKKLMDNVDCFWKKSQFSNDLTNQLVTKLKRLRTYYYIYLVLLFTAIVTYLSMPLLKLPEKEFAIPWHPACDYENPSCYWHTYFWQQVHGLCFFIIIGGVDGQFMLFTQYANLQVETVKHAFTLVDVTPDDLGYLDVFGTAIDLHIDVLDFYARVDDIYQWVQFEMICGMLITLSSSIFCLCLDGFPPPTVKIYKYTLFLCMQTFHVFCISFCGQSVTDACESVAATVYEINWYESGNIKIRKGIVRVLEMTQVPVHMTSAKVLHWNYDTFTRVIKTCVSVCTMLQTVYQKDEEE